MRRVAQRVCGDERDLVVSFSAPFLQSLSINITAIFGLSNVARVCA